uniref:Uncharacterized protein n=1 Tax=Angiostrongylus cantonensis TaxID=6313 RepID=A0A0K0DNE1_ANGCA
MRLASATILEQDHHHGLRLREKATNDMCAGVRTTREDGPSKYPSMQSAICDSVRLFFLGGRQMKKAALKKAILPNVSYDCVVCVLF